MFLLLSLASSTALLAGPGPGGRGVRLLESSTTARSPPLMNQAPTGPAGEAANTGSAVKRWLASRCLPFAVLSGNVGFGKMLIKAGANLETLIVEGEFTSLQCAVVLGHVGLVEALAEGGASLEATGKSVGATTPLQLAIGKENVEVIKALIEAGASLEAADGFAPLQFAISQGYDVEVKRALIEGGASLDAAAGGFTPLQLAISLGNIDTLRADLETKASLEAACGFESTPLQQVVSNGNWPSVMAMPDGNIDAIKMLVEAGASLEAEGELPLTALELAMHFGNVDVIKALIQAGGSLEAAEGGSELTAMEFSIDNGNDAEVIEVLIEAGASLEAVCKRIGSTLLQRAAVNGNVDNIKLLIEAGASLEAVGPGIDEVGNTPLKLAIHLGNLDTMEALLEAGASLEAVNEHDLTPREYAAKLLAEEEGTLTCSRLSLMLRLPGGRQGTWLCAPSETHWSDREVRLYTAERAECPQSLLDRV